MSGMLPFMEANNVLSYAVIPLGKQKRGKSGEGESAPTRRSIAARRGHAPRRKVGGSPDGRVDGGLQHRKISTGSRTRSGVQSLGVVKVATHKSCRWSEVVCRALGLRIEDGGFLGLCCAAQRRPSCNLQKDWDDAEGGEVAPHAFVRVREGTGETRREWGRGERV